MLFQFFWSKSCFAGQNEEEAGAAEGTEVEERKECDVASEAGTYVVGKLR